MKNIILQHFDGKLGELEELSVKNISQYAESINAEYRLIRGKPFRDHLTPACQKVYMIDEEFDEYDKVCMVDIDMFTPLKMKENIFEHNGIGLYEEIQKKLHRRLANDYSVIASMGKPYWGGAIYNMDRNVRQKLRSALGGDETWMEKYNKKYNFEDEGIFHTLSVLSSIRIPESERYLDRRWCQCSFLPSPQKAYFIHVREKVTPRGPLQEKIKNYKLLKNNGIVS